MIHLEYVDRRDRCRRCRWSACTASADVRRGLPGRRDQADRRRRRADAPASRAASPAATACWPARSACPRCTTSCELMMKCDMCYDRTSAGKKPMCATVCPSQALFFGTREQIEQLRPHVRADQPLPVRRPDDHDAGEHDGAARAATAAARRRHRGDGRAGGRAVASRRVRRRVTDPFAEVEMSRDRADANAALIARRFAGREGLTGTTPASSTSAPMRGHHASPTAGRRTSSRTGGRTSRSTGRRTTTSRGATSRSSWC